MRSYTLYFLFQIAFCRTIYFYVVSPLPLGIFGGSDGKESACDTGNPGSIPRSKDPLEKGMATHSKVLAGENPMDRGAWRATVHGFAENQTRLSD